MSTKLEIFAKVKGNGCYFPRNQEKASRVDSCKMPMERFEMGCSMYEFSKKLVIREILERILTFQKQALGNRFLFSFTETILSLNNRIKFSNGSNEKIPSIALSEFNFYTLC